MVKINVKYVYMVVVGIMLISLHILSEKYHYDYTTMEVPSVSFSR